MYVSKTFTKLGLLFFTRSSSLWKKFIDFCVKCGPPVASNLWWNRLCSVGTQDGRPRNFGSTRTYVITCTTWPVYCQGRAADTSCGRVSVSNGSWSRLRTEEKIPIPSDSPTANLPPFRLQYNTTSTEQFRACSISFNSNSCQITSHAHVAKYKLILYIYI